MRRIHCILFSLSVAVLPGSFAQAKTASSTALSAAMHQLAEHINKTSTLDADQIKQQTEIIRKNIDRIGQTSDIISEAFDLVASYETIVGPLFMNQTTRGGFPRKPAGGLELDRALLEQLKKRSAGIEHALSAMADDEYGVCEECGQSIHPDRLTVLPDTRTCIRCARSRESERVG